MAWPAGRRIVAAGAVVYAALAAAAVASAHPAEHDASVPVLAACFPLIHSAWGAGFVVTILRGAPQRPVVPGVKPS